MTKWVRNTRASHSCLLAFVLTWAGVSSLIAQTDPAFLEKAIAAWRAREERIKSFDFSWAGDELQTPRNVTPTRDKKALPPKGHGMARMRLALDDNSRVRFEYEGQRWSEEERRFVPSRTLETFSGSRRTLLFAKGHSFPNAHISESNAGRAARDVRCLPLFLALRSVTLPFARFAGNELIATDQEGIVNGRRCRILKQKHETVWIDPERDFTPVRYFQSRENELAWAVEIDYANDKRHGWVPKSWKVVHTSPSGEITDSMLATVSHYIINGDFAEDEFDILFPEGTWVNNYVTGEEHIVREGGRKRRIREGEYDGKNYEALRQSDPPDESWSLAIIGFVIAGLVGVLVIVSMWFFRLRK
jgi:hypothetical protein